jgi:hypothetical protein
MIGLLKQKAVFYGITNPKIEVRDYKSRTAEITSCDLRDFEILRLKNSIGE